jgi:hypothetical protein
MRAWNQTRSPMTLLAPQINGALILDHHDVLW